MTRIQSRLLKDGRIPGVLTRRLLEAMTRRVGDLVPPDELRAELWPNGAPHHWRSCLAHQARQLNAILGATVVERVGNQSEIVGYRLIASALPTQGVTRAERKPIRRWAWADAENRVLREGLAAGLELAALTTQTNAIHGRSRNPGAVDGQIYRLGLRKRPPGLSARRAARILGVTQDSLTNWLRLGVIDGRKHEPSRGARRGCRNGWWVIDETALERFVRERPWEIDWRAMERDHPLALLARSLQSRRPWLTLTQVVIRTGLNEATVLRYLRDGALPGARRATATAGSEHGCWRIPIEDLAHLPAPRRRRAS